MHTPARRASLPAARDRGQGSVEYIGILVVVVVLVAGVVTAVRASDVGATLAGRVTCVVRAIGTQAGDCGGDGRPTYYGEHPESDGPTSTTVEPPRRGSTSVHDDDARDGVGTSSGMGRAVAGHTGDDDDAPEFGNASDSRPPADADVVDQGLVDLRDALSGGSLGVRTRQLAEAKAAIEQLNGQELDAVLAELSDEELEEWVDELEDGWWGGGWSHEERRELWEVLASKASKATLDRMAQFTDELQPGFGQVGGKEAKGDEKSPANSAEYGEISHRLFIGGAQPRDVVQGQLADCWFQAGMMAAAQADPDLIREAITENANGSYTVRFFEDGEPVHVTVTPEMVLMPDGGPAFSNGDTHVIAGDRSRGYELWPLVIEKALAVHWGNDYAALEYDHASVGFELLTGTPATNALVSEGTHSADDLGEVLDGGGMVVAGTPYNDGSLPDVFDRPADEGGLVGEHAYVLTEVDDEAGTMTFVNPWSWDLPHITVTYAEYEQYFSNVYVSEATR